MLAGGASCRRSPATAPAAASRADTAPAPAGAAAGEEEGAASDADVYFAAIAPHLQRVSIYQGPEPFLRELAATPERAQHLLAAHWCASEISNGGFNQFFAGAAGVMGPEAVRAFAALGLADNAAVVEQAMALLSGGKSYPREMKARNRLLAMLKKRSKTDNPFDELDERFFAALKAREGGFDAVAAAYARAGEKQ